jgi:hypothetical protein
MRKCQKENCQNVLGYRIVLGDKIINTQRRKFCFECSPLGSRNTRDLNKPKVKKSKDYQHVKTFRLRKKQKSIDYLGGKCKICGYNKCNAALQFHHKNPAEKDFTISMATSWGFEKIKSELDKCVLLCANCHAEVHQGVSSF